MEQLNSSSEINNPIQSNTIQHETTVEFLINENKLLKLQIEYSTKEINRLRQENFVLNQNFLSKIDDLRIQEAKSARLEKNNEEHLSTIKSLQRKIEDAHKELLNLTMTHKASLANLESIENESKVLQNIIQNLKQANANKDGDINKLLISISKLNTEKSELELQVNTMTSKLTTEKYTNELLANEVKEVRNQKSHIEGRLKIEKENFLFNFNSLNEQIRIINEEKVTLVQNLHNEKNELIKEKDSLQGENSELRLKLEEKEKTVCLQSNKIDDLNNYLLDIKKELIRSDSEKFLLKEIINDKENEIKKFNEFKRKYDLSCSKERLLSRCLSDEDIQMLKTDYIQMQSLYQACKKDLDVSLKNIEDYQKQLSDYPVLKAQLETCSEEIMELNETKVHLLQSTRKIETLEKDLEELTELNKFLSKQNKKLMMENITRRDMQTGAFLFTNLGKENYEKYLYKNIEELEAKFNELFKRVKSLEQENLNYAKEVEDLLCKQSEHIETIEHLQNFTKEMEEINARMKKENQALKYYSQSSFGMWQASDETGKEDLEKLKLKLNELTNHESYMQKEKEKLQEKITQYDEKSRVLHEENVNLQNKLLIRDKELCNARVSISSLENYKSNFQNELANKNSELKILQSENERLKSVNLSIAKDKENLSNSLTQTVQMSSSRLSETQAFLEHHINKILNENASLKSMVEFIQKEVIGVEKFQNEQKDITSISPDIDIIKEKLLDKEKEFFKLTSELEEKKIKLENIFTENSLLKYQLEFLENKLKAFTSERSRTLLPEKEQTESIGDHEIQVQGTNVTNENIIYDQYLSSLKSIESLKQEITLVKEKNISLAAINESLAKNDITAPYKFLFDQLAQVTSENAALINEKNILIEEKENIIKNFSHINLNAEKCKRHTQVLENLIQELQNKNSNMENQLNKQIEKNIDLKKNETLLIEKDAIIQTIERKHNELESHVKSLEDEIENLKNVIKEKEQWTKDLSQHFANEIDNKNKEILEAKAKSFKNFYLAFKKAKTAIEMLQKINSSLEEKIAIGKEEILKKSHNATIDKLCNELSIANATYERDTSQLRKKLSEAEDNIKSISVQYENEKEKLKIMENEIKTFKGISSATTGKLESSIELKTYFGKLLKNMTTASNIISLYSNKIKALESELQNIKEMEIPSLKVCNSCHILLIENQSLREVNKDLNEKLSGSEIKLNENLKKLISNSVEKEILKKDATMLAEYINSSSNKNTNDSNAFSSTMSKTEMEKNKTFSMLINQMRKATKVISMLDHQLKTLTSMK